MENAPSSGVGETHTEVIPRPQRACQSGPAKDANGLVLVGQRCWREDETVLLLWQTAGQSLETECNPLQLPCPPRRLPQRDKNTCPCDHVYMTVLRSLLRDSCELGANALRVAQARDGILLSSEKE